MSPELSPKVYRFVRDHILSPYLDSSLAHFELGANILTQHPVEDIWALAQRHKQLFMQQTIFPLD